MIDKFKFRDRISTLKIPTKKGGFTLIELTVVIVIATIMMTILVIQQNKWNDRLSVNTQAYELALMIRQAQIYSLGVREDPGEQGEFDIGYGVDVSALGDSNQYVFFADRNGNGKYDSGEELETKIFNRNVVFDRICGKVIIFGEVCSDDWLSLISRISITFIRPSGNISVKFLYSNGEEITLSGVPVYSPPAKMYVESADGKVSLVRVNSNGQVSITNE